MSPDLDAAEARARLHLELVGTLKDCATFEANDQLPLSPELVQRMRPIALAAIKAEATAKLREFEPATGWKLPDVSGFFAWAWEKFSGMAPSVKTSSAASVGAILLWVVLVLTGHMPSPWPVNPVDPPTPVVPIPVVDPLDDDFTSSIKSAWKTETDPDKLKHVATLAALYKQSASTVNDPTLATAADLLGRMKAAAHTLLPDDALPLTRRAVANDLNATIGTSATAALDTARRKTIEAKFQTVAKTLGGLK